MKTIDWKEISSNTDMSKQFTLEVYNKFQSLSTSEIDAENIEDVYSGLIVATEEIALATLPKKKSRGQSKPSNSPTVIEARNHLKSISLAYHHFPFQTLKMQMITASKILMMLT